MNGLGLLRETSVQSDTKLTSKENWKIKRNLPVSWSWIEILSHDNRRREITWDSTALGEVITIMSLKTPSLKQGHRDLFSEYWTSPGASSCSGSFSGKDDATKLKCQFATPFPKRIPPLTQEPPPAGMSCPRGSFGQYKFSEEGTDVIMSSWRTGTKKQYATYINKWHLKEQSRQLMRLKGESKAGLA